MKSILVRVAKKVAYVCAALVIIAALSVIASRFLTPYVDARRGEMEALATTIVQSPVTIEKATVSWFQYHPGVALHNVTIRDKDTNEPVLQLRTVKVFISIPQSIWQRKLVPGGMLISGADLVVHQSPKGEFVLQGFPALGGYDKEPFKGESKFKDVAAWLSMQPLIILREIDVRFTGATGIKRFVTLYNLKLENSDTVHSLIGKAILHQNISTGLTLAVHWEGMVADTDKITGKIYINLSGLSLAQWFKGLAWNGWEIRKGLLSAKIWATWSDGGFNRIQSSVRLLNLDLFSDMDKSVRKVNRLDGNIGWKREGKDQIIAGDDILIDWSSRLWPVTSFYLKLSPDNNQKLTPVMMNLGYLDLSDTRELLASSPKFLSDNLLKMLKDLDLDGNLENISITFSRDTTDKVPVLMQGRFSGIGFRSLDHLPAAENLSGAFVWKGDGGSFSLQSRQAVIRYPSIFAKPLMFEQLTGDVLWLRDANNEWKFVFKSVGALNQDFALNLNGHLLLPESLKPKINISANFTLHDVSHLKRYLPVHAFDKNLTEWLNEAFLSGSAESGSLVLRGVLPDFPFDHDNGSFLVTTAVNNVTLHYAPGWPDLKNITGNVQFSGRKILIDINKANMLDIDIGRAHGEIPYLGSDKPAVLTVYTTPIHADLTKGMHFLHVSPLKKTIGKMFRDIDLKGQMELGLALTVPLENPDDTEVKGVLDISNAKMELKPWKLDIDKLNGKVNFTERSTDAAAIQGELFGKPLRLDLDSTHTDDDKSVIVATVTNNIDLMDIENWLQVPLSTVAKGTTNMTAKIDLAVDKPIVINIDTNLTGVTLDLPMGYMKTANEVRRFTADITVEDKKPLKLQVNYADLLNAALVLDRSQNKFDLVSANLRLGKGKADWPQGKGLYITGSMKELDADKIRAYFLMSSKNKTDGLPLRLVDVNVDALSLYGVKLSPVRLQLVPANAAWMVTVTSPDIAGKIQVPSVFGPKSTLMIDLQRINLDAFSGGTESSMVVANLLPVILFSADSVRYTGSEIHNVSFNTLPSTSGLAITSLTVRSANFNLQGSGDWVQSGQSNQTRLHGKATSKNVSGLLDGLGFDVHNFVSSNGTLNFDLNWSNPPYALTLNSMSGGASIEMGKGRIVEVSQASDAKMDLGRMLNLFSLQSIPRRLSLDFSDVFMKGYSFDTLKGDFRFGDGTASTKNMRFDGPLAKVEIRGKIGVARKNFDLILSVTPYVTSSIPVAATLITGQPVIGVAAWAVSKIIGSEVSKAVTYYYSVTGSWSNPNWNVIQGMRNSARQ